MSKLLESKLQTVYNFTVEYIEDNGFPPSVREICSKCDIKSTASAYLYLERLKERGLLLKSPLKKRAIAVPSKSKDYVKIPLVGTVTAGLPIFAVENLDGYIPLPNEFENEKDCFALRVQGESMINVGIYNNDIIIVNKCDTADNGQIVVALIEDSATVKRFFKRDGQIVLHPENNDMSDMFFSDVKILGVVKGLIRKF